MVLGGVLAAGGFAAFVAVGSTVLIERCGGLLGGVISTVPSTIVPASVGIALQGGDFATAMSAVPVGMLLDVGFLWLWRVVPPRFGRLPVLSTSRAWLVSATAAVTVLAWAVMALLTSAVAFPAVARSGVHPVAIGLGAWIVTAGAGAAATSCEAPSPTQCDGVAEPPQPTSLITLTSRACAAAAAISASVLIARSEGHATLSGVAATFPAIFLTTMVSLWLQHGASVPGSAIGPMMFGANAVSSYALLSVALFPQLGVVGGAIAAWALAVALWSVPVGAFLFRRQQRDDDARRAATVLDDRVGG